MFFFLFFPVCVLIGSVGVAVKSIELCATAIMAIVLGSLQWQNQNNEAKNNEELCQLRALKDDLIQWNNEEEQCTIQIE